MDAQPSDTIELGHVARTILRGWRAIVGFTMLGIVGAAAIILYAPRKYTGIATVVIKAGGGGGGGSSVLSQIGGLGDITAGLLGGKSPMETEMEILSSRSVVDSVIDSLRLQAEIIGAHPLPTAAFITHVDLPGSFEQHRYHFHKVGNHYQLDGGAVTEMLPGAVTALPMGQVTFRANAQLPATFDLIIRDRQDAEKWIDRHLKVDKDKGEIASVTYKGDDSVTAELVPNGVIDAYLARRRGSDRGINQRRVEFLTAKNDTMELALAASARALRRQQEASGVFDAPTVAKSELENGTAIRSKLTDVLVEQGALKQLIDQITSKQINPRELAAYPRFLSSPAINNLVSQLSDFETRRTLLLATRAEGDRDVVALEKSAANTEAKLLPYAQTYSDALARQRADLEHSLAKVDSNLAGLPRASESATQLERDVMDLSKLSAVLQAQIVEAKLAAIGEGGDVKLLDPAIVPKKPSFPDPLITAAVGTFAGIVCGLIGALLVGSVGRWMRDPLEVERSTGVPALHFDPAVPLLLSDSRSRTIVVAPIEAGISVTAVVNRLAQTATSRSLSAAVLDLPATATDINGSIARLEAQHDLVIVQLPSLVSDSAAAALQHTRPVLLVAPGRKIERRRLLGAVQMLKRLEVPVAGIVMTNGSTETRALQR